MEKFRKIILIPLTGLIILTFLAYTEAGMAFILHHFSIILAFLIIMFLISFYPFFHNIKSALKMKSKQYLIIFTSLEILIIGGIIFGVYMLFSIGFFK
jgi:hypothetical protein